MSWVHGLRSGKALRHAHSRDTLIFLEGHQIHQILCKILHSEKHCVQYAGPKDKLDSTAVSQPAIYVASLAALEKLKQTEGQVCISGETRLWASLH